MTLTECPQCLGIGAPCGNLGDNNHCEHCNGTGQIDPVDKACEDLICQLLRAHADIGHWIAFAKRQMRELPRWDRLPCGPTTNGVRASEDLRSKIVGAIQQYRRVSPK